MTVNYLHDSYTIQYTDKNKTPITLVKNSLNQTSLDIALVGKDYKEYGILVNESILHIMENFACPEDSTIPGTPDLSSTNGIILSNPIEGELWFNKTQGLIFSYDGNKWVPGNRIDSVVGLSGVISNGATIPLPTSPVTGLPFKVSECVWFVSPYNFPDAIDYMACFTDDTAKVTMEYVLTGNTRLSYGYANFAIMGIKNNVNIGSSPVPPSTPPVTLTPTPTPAASPTGVVLPTPTPTSSVIASPPVTISPTLTPSITPTLTPTPSVTPSVPALAATLFISPSNGYPTSTTQLVGCNTASGSVLSCEQSLQIILSNISGGVAPYTVDFSNIIMGNTIRYTTSGNTVRSSMALTYGGGNGTSNSPIRTGITTGIVTNTSGRIYPTGAFDTTQNAFWQITINGTSNVIITDAVGSTLILYTPSGSEGNIYGSAFVTAQGNYTDGYFSSSA